ncbi:hypothetical protein [Agrobacterium sp. CG674]
MSIVQRKPHQQRFDPKDRLILALHAQLRAERETREAMEWVMRNGGLSPEVLEAMASDPIPVVTADDMRAANRAVTHLRLSAEGAAS